MLIGILVTEPWAARLGEAAGASPDDAPSMIAMKRIGQNFQESDSDSAVMIVLEGQEPLGDAAHKFYDEMVAKLEADTKHVQHIQDFWSDPLTASGSQSNDGKAAYVQAYLAGNQGESLANESVESVRQIIEGVTNRIIVGLKHAKDDLQHH